MKALAAITFFAVQILLAQESGQGYLLLQNDDMRSGSIKITQPFAGSTMFLLDDSIKFPAQKIKAYELDGKYFGRVKTWSGSFKYVERKEKGRLNIFYDWETSWVRDPVITYAVTSYNAKYFSKENGELHKISVGNLMKATADFPPSQKPLHEYRKLTWVCAGFVVAGVAIIATAYKGVDKEHPPKAGRLVAGGIVSNLAWIPALMRSGKVDEAIELYNHR